LFILLEQVTFTASVASARTEYWRRVLTFTSVWICNG